MTQPAIDLEGLIRDHKTIAGGYTNHQSNAHRLHADAARALGVLREVMVAAEKVRVDLRWKQDKGGFPDGWGARANALDEALATARGVIGDLT